MLHIKARQPKPSSALVTKLQLGNVPSAPKLLLRSPCKRPDVTKQILIQNNVILSSSKDPCLFPDATNGRYKLSMNQSENTVKKRLSFRPRRSANVTLDPLLERSVKTQSGDGGKRQRSFDKLRMTSRVKGFLVPMLPRGNALPREAPASQPLRETNPFLSTVIPCIRSPEAASPTRYWEALCQIKRPGITKLELGNEDINLSSRSNMIEANQA